MTRIAGWVKTIRRIDRYSKEDESILQEFIRIKAARRGGIYLFGSPVHGNLGDHLIALSEMDYFRNHMKNRPAIRCCPSATARFASRAKRRCERSSPAA